MHEIGMDRATSNAACTSYRILTCLQPVPDRSIFTIIHASEYEAYFPSFSANLGPYLSGRPLASHMALAPFVSNL